MLVGSGSGRRSGDVHKETENITKLLTHSRLIRECSLSAKGLRMAPRFAGMAAPGPELAGMDSQAICTLFALNPHVFKGMQKK